MFREVEVLRIALRTADASGERGAYNKLGKSLLLMIGLCQRYKKCKTILQG